MTPLAAFLWLAELGLEAAGAVYCFKVSCGGVASFGDHGSSRLRVTTGIEKPPQQVQILPAGIHLLGAYLAFRAIADLICMVIMGFSYSAYAWADYGQRVIQYALFALLCIRVAAEVLRASEHTRKFYSGAAIVSWATGTLYFHFVAPLNMHSLLRFESGAHILAGAFLAVAMYSGAPGRILKHVAHGLLTLAGTDAALAIAQGYRGPTQIGIPIFVGQFARAILEAINHALLWMYRIAEPVRVVDLYPLGAIAGLILLLWAVSRKEEPLPIGAVRLNLGVRTVSR